MTSTRRPLSLGQVEPIEFSDLLNTPTTVSGYGITDTWTKTEADARYLLASSGTYDPINLSLTGATVIANLDVDEFGNTTNVTTRTLTPANIGAQPAGSYEVTTNKSTNTSLGISDILYPTQRAVKTYVDETVTLQGVTDNGNTTTNGITVNGILNNSSYTQNANGWTMNGHSWVMNFPNNTHSRTSFILQNTSSPNPGGIRVTERGSTIIRARGDSVTDYYILRLQGSANGQATIFDVAQNGLTQIGLSANIPASGLLRVGGTVAHDDATSDIQSMTLGQYRTDSHVVTGLKRFRGGAGGGADTVITRWEYPDDDGEDYNLKLLNNSDGNNVGWFFQQKMIVGDNQLVLDYPTLGFRNGVTVIGDYRYPSGSTGIESYYNDETDPATRYKLSLYVVGDSILSNNLIVGQEGYASTSFLEAEGPFIKSTGVVYADDGFRTPDPDNPSGTKDHTTWLLGDASADVETESTHTIRVSIDGVLYDIMARAV